MLISKDTKHDEFLSKHKTISEISKAIDLFVDDAIINIRVTLNDENKVIDGQLIDIDNKCIVIEDKGRVPFSLIQSFSIRSYIIPRMQKNNPEENL